MSRLQLLQIFAITTAALAACGDGAPTDSGAGAREQQSAVRTNDRAAEHSAEGTLNSFDPLTGTVNISHGAVASADWPAMTMTFKLADPNAAAEIEQGTRVRFSFTVDGGMNATVTEIAPAE